MKQKKHVHKCNLAGLVRCRKKITRNTDSFADESATRKALMDIYNKYYRNQVAALYRAINE